MARRGENIYKRKDGRWEGRYKNGIKPDGTAKYSSVYGKSYSEVRNILLEKRSGSRTEPLKCGLTFGKLAELWLDSIINNVKDSTYSNYSMKLEKHILPRFGGIKYEKMTVKILNDFIAEKIGGGLSVNYVADICRLIKSIAKFARVKLGFSDKTELLSLPKYERKEPDILDFGQQNTLIAELMKDPSPSDLGILIAAVTGIRIGELCALKWSDIDLEKRIFTVNKTLQRIRNTGGKTSTKIIITPPKSKSSSRIIPIPEFILPVLTANAKPGDCYVLTGKKIFSEPRAVQYKFKSLLKKLELPRVRFHALRHMFATRCVSAGFDVKTLSEILGHSSADMTMRRYVHSSLERKISCFILFSNSLESSFLPS